MTDEQAFLAKIIAAPDDDVPRLVYADWLDGQASSSPCAACGGSGHPRPTVADMPPVRERVTADGRIERDQEWPAFDYRIPRCKACSGTGSIPDQLAARAEFIRVQCRTATCKMCDGTGRNVMSPCPCSLLNVRARDLLDAHGHDWGGPGLAALKAADPHYGETWVRGLLAEVSCTSAAWLAHGDAITAAHPVRTVRLTTWPEIESGMRGDRLVGREKWRLPLHEHGARLPEHLLGLEWPGVTFELPPAPTVTTRVGRRGMEIDLTGGLPAIRRGETPVFIDPQTELVSLAAVGQHANGFAVWPADRSTHVSVRPVPPFVVR